MIYISSKRGQDYNQRMAFSISSDGYNWRSLNNCQRNGGNHRLSTSTLFDKLFYNNKGALLPTSRFQYGTKALALKVDESWGKFKYFAISLPAGRTMINEIEFESSVQDLKDATTTLTKTVVQNEKKANDNAAKVATLQRSVNTNTGKIGNAEKKINANTVTAKANTGKISTAEQNINANKNQIQANFNTLKGHIDTQSISIDQAFEEVKGYINDVKQQTDDLKQQTDDQRNKQDTVVGHVLDMIRSMSKTWSAKTLNPNRVQLPPNVSSNGDMLQLQSSSGIQIEGPTCPTQGSDNNLCDIAMDVSKIVENLNEVKTHARKFARSCKELADSGYQPNGHYDLSQDLHLSEKIKFYCDGGWTLAGHVAICNSTSHPNSSNPVILGGSNALWDVTDNVPNKIQIDDNESTCNNIALVIEQDSILQQVARVWDRSSHPVMKYFFESQDLKQATWYRKLAQNHFSKLFDEDYNTTFCQDEDMTKNCVDASIDTPCGVYVNHQYDSPGNHTCDCVAQDDPCFENDDCVIEPECMPAGAVTTSTGSETTFRGLYYYNDDGESLGDITAAGNGAGNDIRHLKIWIK